MTPAPPPQRELSEQWSSALRLYPVYFQLSREFVIDVKPVADLEAAVASPGRESVEAANNWLDEMDQRIQVHQLRQFLQTSALVDQDTLLNLLTHFLAKTERSDAVRDKIDFLLVQYFSQIAPAQVTDEDVDLAFVAQTMEAVIGAVELKAPLWLNALDRVLDSARRCRSLDELLHGGVLEQGRKAKAQAGDLFYMPIALVAFTRFGYLMRRAFFRLMHGDLNTILDGLTELEEKGIETIDCRRAQFSADEPILRLRMICQSWKVMFQAEYSSGQPLRMLVDLRASVEHALGRGSAAPAEEKAPAAKPAAAAKIPAKPLAKAAAASATSGGAPKSPVAKPAAGKAVAPQPPAAAKSVAAAPAKPPAQFAVESSDTPEFEISVDDGWEQDGNSPAGKKK